MLLNNFSNILSAKLTYGTSMGDKVNYIKTTDGTIYENNIRTSNINLYKVAPTSDSTTTDKSGIIFVLSNDENELPVKYDDYEIEGYIDDQLTEIGTTINNSNNYIVSKIVQNNTDDDVSINTIGVMVHCYLINDYKDILFYKIKSDTPIIIKPGETKTFTITIG